MFGVGDCVGVRTADVAEDPRTGAEGGFPGLDQLWPGADERGVGEEARAGREVLVRAGEARLPEVVFRLEDVMAMLEHQASSADEVRQSRREVAGSDAGEAEEFEVVGDWGGDVGEDAEEKAGMGPNGVIPGPARS